MSLNHSVSNHNKTREYHHVINSISQRRHRLRSNPSRYAPIGVFRHLGVQPSNNPAFSDAHKVLLTFELPHERIDFEKDGVTTNQPRVSSKEYTLSIGDKANLKRDLVSWRGREFTPEEKESFDISVLAGVNNQINIVHKVSGKGTTYANITSISPLSKGMTKAAPENPICIYMLPDEGNIVIPETVPEWIAKKIMASLEYQEFLLVSHPSLRSMLMRKPKKCRFNP